MTRVLPLDRADWHLLFDAVEERLLREVAGPCPAQVRDAVLDCANSLRYLQQALVAEATPGPDAGEGGAQSAPNPPPGALVSAPPAHPYGRNTPPAPPGPADGGAPGC